jgi:hypothetical protein
MKLDGCNRERKKKEKAAAAEKEANEAKKPSISASPSEEKHILKRSGQTTNLLGMPLAALLTLSLMYFVDSNC